MTDSPTQDNKPTSLDEVLALYENTLAIAIQIDGEATRRRALQKCRNQAKAAIAAYYEGLIPKKRRQPKQGGSMCKDWLIGHNQAIDTIHRNFTGQTDNERKQMSSKDEYGVFSA